MKVKILALFAALAFAGELNAQIMEDSTVQVVAYWQVGDKCSYNYEQSKYQCVDGDTILVSTHTERLI